MTSRTLPLKIPSSLQLGMRIRQVAGVCKLRIGVTIAFTALAGVAVTPGPALGPWQVALFGLAVLLSAAAAGGFNQYLERDLDAKMTRTRGRAFVTGELESGPIWVAALTAVLVLSVLLAAAVTNATAAAFVLLGALTYGVIYTLWLKRRTWLNIVLGGLAGSFAVLAGAAAVDPRLGPIPLWFATILFLWTPSHFWSLAIAMADDYRRAGVPMLPVIIGNRRAARVVLLNTLALVSASLAPATLGLGWLYLSGAVAGGAYFLVKNVQMARTPDRKAALACFHASLAQLTLLLTAAIADAHLVGGL